MLILFALLLIIYYDYFNWQIYMVLLQMKHSWMYLNFKIILFFENNTFYHKNDYWFCLQSECTITTKKMSGKREQILIIEPPMELSFKGKFQKKSISFSYVYHIREFSVLLVTILWIPDDDKQNYPFFVKFVKCRDILALIYPITIH